MVSGLVSGLVSASASVSGLGLVSGSVSGLALPSALSVGCGCDCYSELSDGLGRHLAALVVAELISEGARHFRRAHRRG